MSHNYLQFCVSPSKSMTSSVPTFSHHSSDFPTLTHSTFLYHLLALSLKHQRAYVCVSVCLSVCADNKLALESSLISSE